MYLFFALLFIHSYSDIINVADKLYFEKEYKTASIEYRRAFFYYPDSVKPSDYAKFLIDLYKVGKDFSKDVYMDELEELDNDEKYYNLIFYYDLLHDENKLFLEDVKNDKIGRLINVYKAALIGNKEGLFCEDIDTLEDSTCYYINILKQKVKKHPEYAIIMSAIIPGSGFLYLGEYSRGMNMFITNVFLDISRFYMFYKYYPFIKLAFSTRKINSGLLRLSVNSAMGSFVYDRFDDGNRKLITKYALNYNRYISESFRNFIISSIEDSIFSK